MMSSSSSWKGAVLALISVSALGGCAQNGLIQRDWDALNNFAVGDLNRAIDDAKARSDSDALACYSKIQEIIKIRQDLTEKANKAGEPVGAFSLNQFGRDIALDRQQLRKVCAPVIVQEQDVIPSALMLLPK